MNELYSLHQRALLHAANTDDRRTRKRLEVKADRLAEEIAEIQAANGSHVVKLFPAARF
ncbi:hypothetical protein [Altererythrobacter sp. Z27]|uniref:hypothetical protein n=1 Tax=Altererythrobacter sp. Z27 TaxID=3461147 RepID=UPI004045053E